MTKVILIWSYKNYSQICLEYSNYIMFKLTYMIYSKYLKCILKGHPSTRFKTSMSRIMLRSQFYVNVDNCWDLYPKAL